MFNTKPNLTPIVGPLLGLLRSRKFMVALLTLAVDVLVVYVPALKPVQAELLTVFTLIGSALVAVGGILQAMDTGVFYTMGTQAVIIATMAVLLGGMGSFTGSALGGLFIGMAMSLSIWGLPSEWQLTVGFGALVLVISLRPRGFLGGKVVKSEV